MGFTKISNGSGFSNGVNMFLGIFDSVEAFNVSLRPKTSA